MHESGTADTAPSCGSSQAVARCITIPGDADRVPGVRHWVSEECAGREESWVVELLTSELVTNAIRHSRSGDPGGRVHVELELAQDVTVTVQDQGGDDMPVVHPPDGDRDGGRGLELVDQLATEWGHKATDDGRVVWCRIDGTAPQ